MTEVEPTENQGWGNRQDGGGMLSVGGAGGEVRMKRSSTYLLSQLETQQKAKQQALQAVNQPNSEKISNIRKSVAVMSGPPETLGPQRRYSHRLSTVAGTNKRHSVEVRKSNLRLSAFDEVSPLAPSNQQLTNANKKLHLKRFLNQISSEHEDETAQPRESITGVYRRKSFRPSIGLRTSHYRQMSTVEPLRNMDEAVPNAFHGRQSQMLTNKLRRLTLAVAQTTTSKEERKLIRTFRVFIAVWCLAFASSVYGVVRLFWRPFGEIDGIDIEGIVVSVVQIILSVIVILMPRPLLTKKFRGRVAKNQRLQNLRNVFLEKEVEEFNKGLQMCLV